jgi:hypothetical protein
MLGVWAAWALAGFGYPSAPLPIALNIASKILAFVAAFTLFSAPAARARAGTEPENYEQAADQPGWQQPSTGLSPTSTCGAGPPNRHTDPRCQQARGGVRMTMPCRSQAVSVPSSARWQPIVRTAAPGLLERLTADVGRFLDSEPEHLRTCISLAPRSPCTKARRAPARQPQCGVTRANRGCRSRRRRGRTRCRCP